MMKRKTAVIFGIIIAAQLCLTPYAGAKVQAAELEEGQMFEDSSEDTETFEDASIPDTQSAEKPEENEFGDDDGFSDGDVETFSAEDADQSCENMQELVLNVQDGEDITVKLNTLLAQARDRATDEKQCKVIVPPGNYTLTGTLHMYSNIRCSPKANSLTGKKPKALPSTINGSAANKNIKKCSSAMKRIVILGAGESGAGAAVLAKKEGFDVFVSDTSSIKDKYKKLLDDHQIEWEEGHHTEEKILNADEVIKSPGIPKEAPMMQKLMAQHTHIISEIEFAGRYTHAKMICITGSNGKTTTTSLIYHIFKSAGYDVGLAGNIGKSLALQVAEEPHEYYIIELSSFQLDNMYDFRANIAILLNITPDHLDRYDFKFQNYVDAKMRIIQNQTADDHFIYWNDDPVIKKQLDKYDIKAVQCPFSELKEKGSIAYIEEGQYKLEYPTPFNMEQEELSLTGKHNIYNSLAAGLASNISGIKKEIIRKSLSDFPGVEHRLEKVCDVAGVHYVNDSKATNVDACWYALESMRTPVILILGGKDKGNDYNAIKELVQQKCVGLVYLGADNTKLHNFFDQLGIPVRDTHNMKDCVKACYDMARPGDTVLLSPCCASFDLFHNMEDRGEQFKQQVRNL